MASQKLGLEARDGAFFLDGKKIVLLSGTIHYFRVVPEYWKDRLMRLKAAGLNCVETYVPWNVHEEVRGEFNFEGILDVRKYLQLARELGLYVIFRPGPYICAEWEFGGLPSWLLRDPQMMVRSSYQLYLDAVDAYFAKLLPLVADLQYKQGGPIIAVQLENEYGSYCSDLKYKKELKRIFLKYGIKELLFTSDNGVGIKTGEFDQELITANFQEQEHGYLLFEYLKNVKQPGRPLMAMEFWTGWFDHCGQRHQVWPPQNFEKVLTWILDQGASVNLYMFHGGSTFGFMNGANQDLGATNSADAEPYSPDIQSYDYDAPVSENGDLTEKYEIIRKLIKKRFTEQIPGDLPEPPAPIKSTSYGSIDVKSYLTLNDMLSSVAAITSENLMPMEHLDINNGGGQSFGFTMYRTNIQRGSKLKLLGEPKDRAIIILDGKRIDVVDWTMTNHVTELGVTSGEHVLDILVENCGRVNYGDAKSKILDNQRKGLYKDSVLLDGVVLREWKILPLEFKKKMFHSVLASDKWKPSPPQDVAPVLCRASLNIVGEPMDTYLHCKKMGKGVVFVNGFNLGRYWSTGPQETMYIPGPLLKQGDNEVVIFEVNGGERFKTLEFTIKPILGEPQIHGNVILDFSL